ncbi:hypothetical protein AVEN_82904-1, partial [Araneus ventricosus]
MVDPMWHLLKRGVKRPNKDNWTPLINEDIHLPNHPSKEVKRLKPAVLGVKATPVDRPEQPGK